MNPKIVRDKIPEIIAESGKLPVYDVVSIDVAIAGLETKLHEELAEYMADHSLEEMADLLEVMHGILFLKGISWEEFEKIRLAKRAERGGFEKCLLLKDIIDHSDK